MTNDKVRCQKMPTALVIAGEAISALLGLIGVTNVILIGIILINKNLNGSIYVYILNMSFSSCVFLGCAALDAVYIYYESYIFGKVVLHFHVYIWEAILISNVLSLLALTYERYISVFEPIKYISSVKRTYFKIGCVWIVSFILAIPFSFAYTIRSNNCTSEFPFYDNNGVVYSRVIYSVQSILLYFIPMIFMIVAYMRIILCKKKSDFDIHKQIFQKDYTNKQSYKELLSIIKVAIALVLYFFILWTPFILTRWIYYFDSGFSPILRRSSQLFLLIYPSFSAVVYVCTNKKLRKCVKTYIPACTSK